MTMRWKPALGALAAALLIGNPAWAEEVVKTETVEAEEAPANCEACEEAKEEEEKEEECEFGCWKLNSLFGECFTKKTGFSASGWVVQSFTYNPQDPLDGFNGPVTFNDRANEYLMNQAYGIFQRAVDTEGDNIDFGFRADLLYGTDATFTQALGLDDDILTGNRFYRLAIPQLYAEMFVPVGEGLSVKVGHFYTLLGYEVVTTPDNFFTTLPYTFQYGEPFTHTGVMTSMKLNKQLTMHNCLIRGWDSWNDNNNGIGYMGGLAWTSEDEKTSIACNVITSAEQDEPNRTFQGFVGSPAIGAPSNAFNRFMYSLVVQRKLGEKFKYVFQHDYGFQAGGGTANAAADLFANPSGIPFAGAQWYGINQYLFYDINDKWAVGIRGEWFRDDDGARVGIARSASNIGPNSGAFGAAAPGLFTGTFGPANYYEISLGLNWKPLSCLTLRPELRWDWQQRDNAGVTPAYDTQTQTSQFLAAFDVIYKF